MTNEKTVIAAFHEKLDKRISEIDAKDLLESHTLDKILEAVKSVKPGYKVRENGIGLIISILNNDGQSKPKKSKKQAPADTIVEEYNRMVEAGIITADEKFQLLQKSASREVRVAVAKNQYPNHPRLWGRAAGLDVNQMVVFCELDPVQQENPDWTWIDQEAERCTVEWQREWIDTGKINEVSIAGTIGNIAQKWDATDKVPF